MATIQEQGVSSRQVVIDAGAAIRLQRLERFGGELLTTGGVYAEVKDENARALLKTLPVELKIREPLPQDLAYVRQFAKATGDFGYLSNNDIDLIALTVRLQREAGCPLKDRPAALSHSTEGKSVAFDWAPPAPTPSSSSNPGTKTASHTNDSEGTNNDSAVSIQQSTTSAQDESVQATTPSDSAVSKEQPTTSAQDESVQATQATPSISPETSRSTPPGCQQQLSSESASKEVDDDNADEDNQSEDGSSAGEWVTQENLHRFGTRVEADVSIRVTCATSDYSVQNVLLQMGIIPLTFDGYAVKSVKMWGLICRACFFFHRDSTKVFCPKCGNDTVVRVPIVIGEDGVPTVLNQGRQLRKKGTVYSVPKPQQGRGWKPIFAEDELLMGGRDREQRHLQKVWDKERASRDPFNEDNGARAWYQRGTTATGRQIVGGGPRVQAGYGRCNPNANNFKGFGQKKRR